MKTLKLALGALVLLAISYVGATYYFSSSAASSADLWAKKIVGSGLPLHLVSNDYKRGFLTSTQEITYELPFPTGGAKPASFTVRNVIHHGPLPAFSGLGMARIEHSIVFNGEVSKAIAKAFGDQPPVRAVSRLGFGGGGETEFIGAAANYQASDGKIAWQGLTGTIHFTKEMGSYQGEIVAPGLTVDGPKGGAQLKGLSLKVNQTKLANTETVYLGTSGFKLDLISVNGPGAPIVELKDLTLDSEANSKDGEFLDFVARFGIKNIRGESFTATNGEYAITGAHVHAPSLDKLNKALQAVNEKLLASKDPQNAADDMQGMAAALRTHGLPILQRDPVLSIDRIGFKTDQGEAKITGALKFSGVKEADIQSANLLLAKLDANANITISEGILKRVMTASRSKAMQARGFQANAADSEQLALQAEAAEEQQLSALTAQGFATRANGVLSTKLAFKGGQFMINDKPYRMGARAP